MTNTLRSVLCLSILAFAIVALPREAFATDILISPAAVQTTAGGSFSVTVAVSGNAQSINAVSGTVNFSTANLTLSSVSKDGSIVQYWADEPSYSNVNGTLSFSGLILNPGFSGSRGTLLTLRFTAKATGTATIGVSSGSVLANDGKATPVLGSLGTASVIVSAKESALIAPATPVSGAPAITSATHPDQNGWYNSTEPVFTWSVPTGVSAVRIAYGTKPDTVPTVVYTPAVKQKALTDIGNGTYYFHAQFRAANGIWGPVSHYRFQVDTESPEPFEVRVEGAKLSFEATDTISGIDRYEVAIADEEPIVVKARNSHEVPARASGTHPVTVRAIDRAGNVTQATAEVTFAATAARAPEPAPVSAFAGFGTMHTLYAVLAVLVLLTLVVIWVALVRYGVLKSRIKRELDSIEETLRTDFESIRDHFAVHSSAKVLTKTAIARMFRTSKTNIDLIERDITSKIDAVKKKL